MAGLGDDVGRSLLEREEAALTGKRTAIKAVSSSLESLRRSTTETRLALQILRTLGFAQRDLVDSFALTRDEVLQYFPRRPRQAGHADEAHLLDEAPIALSALSPSGLPASNDFGEGVKDPTKQPRQSLQDHQQ